MYQSNGLIDDLIVYGTPEDYLLFAELVKKAINAKPTLMLSELDISIEIKCDESKRELFTSLQNEANEYYSMEDWNNRKLLRIHANSNVLASLQSFLHDLSVRGDGYSYLSEYSKSFGYSGNSPEWRLHVEST
jgi:hypothetical protein